ncbi:cell adhesion molecule Dscam2 isoform X2 [Frankliniella occidentalis]|uniref:Cell adhesion molecule Dscam2 isoform X2 n=1 Tax=Frankliniella occidentalis TaxID=133901 RepID=A0A9C6UE45_FRAOC|nr:cell adhesion molecule Dscam2 isoform X2 [Frankliniella occidentalis]
MATGSPAPRISWLLADGSPALPVAGLRHTHPNGSLELPAFPGDRYRQDVHAVTYRCRASNQAGAVLSKDVHVRGVVKQDYDVQVYDEHVVAGNTAALKCHVAPYVAEYIMVTSWEVDQVNLYPSTDVGGKHLVLANGDLYIQDVSPSDRHRAYTCRTLHRLTGQTRASPTPGRVIITEPKGSAQLRLTVEKHQSVLAKVGEDAVLPCLAQGHPVPSYKWHREERQGRLQLQPLQLDDRVGLLAAGLLRLKKARLSDAGQYVCTVSNSAGEETVHVALTVTAPLSAHVSPPWQEVSTGSEALLECSVAGQPVARVQWLRDGLPLQPSPRVSITTAPAPSAALGGAGPQRHPGPGVSRVKLTGVGKEDRGMYQCVASNDRDMAQGTAELKLGDAVPELVYSFSEQTLQPGPAVSLKCMAVGIPPPQFSWTLDGFPLPESPRFLVGQYVTIHDDVISHVNISYVKEEDGGEYTCTARNSVGSKSHSARVNVYGKPYIREMPRITAVAGKDLVIKCPAAGYPIESISWEHNGQALPSSRRQKVFPNGTLLVQQTRQGEDQGTYTCQAVNRQKHSARRDVEVAVQIPPRILPTLPLNLSEGMRAAISCQILEGDQPVGFRWERDGRPLQAQDGAYTRRHDEFSSALIIERVAAKHTANYTCIASNVAGPDRFTVPLIVNVPPRWLVEPVDTSVSAGQDVWLHAEAEGSPPPSVLWKKAVPGIPGEYRDLALFDHHVNLMPNGTLHFVRVSKESEGHYMCEAGNSVGSDVSKVVFLKVNAPAHFPTKWRQVQVAKGEAARLQCAAQGDPPIDIQWRQAGQRLAVDTDHRLTLREQPKDAGHVSELTIERATRHDTATFSCTASNAYGQDEMTIQLVVQEVAEMPQNVRVTEQQSRSVQLSWPPPYSGNSPISAYVLQYKLVADPWPSNPMRMAVSGSQASATLSGLSPATSYHVRILAENRLGLSEPSEAIQVTTQEESPSGAPQAVRAEARSSTELVVTWEPPPRDMWHGSLQGYYVGYQQVFQLTQMAGTDRPTRDQYMLKTVEVGSQYGGEASLIGLAKFTTYNVVVQAYNSRGAGPMSEPVTVRTMEDVPSMPPEKLNCRPTSTQELQIQWQAPPEEGRNGDLQGFKVLFRPVEEWFDKESPEVKTTSSTSTTLPGLLSFTNYSIIVLAFTGSGDGVRTPPVFCRTEEDVPSAPADIKALTASANTVLVAWLPPANLNGVLMGYTFYWNYVRDDGKEGSTHTVQLGSQTETHEVQRLSPSSTYRFWVTASTRVGEGEPSKIASVRPNGKVPARIASFSRTLVTPWKRNVSLACAHVGTPAPQVGWRFNQRPLESSGRVQVNAGALLVRDVQHSDEGNYSCTVENAHGQDDITYSLVVMVPPGPPALAILATDADSLHLQWTDSEPGVPVLGYVINYKRDHGDWEELQLESKVDSYVLRGLLCGNRYQLYMTAYNRIGTGLPCDIVHTATRGSVPVTPSQAALLTVNSTVVTLWLDAWADGGCPIQYLIVEYREVEGDPWQLVSNHVLPSERARSVADLTPGSRYQLRVTAHNSAGSVWAVYNFTTLSLAGGPLPQPPDDDFPATADEDAGMSVNFRVLLPIVLCSATVIMLAYAGMHIGKRKLRQRASSPEVMPPMFGGFGGSHVPLRRGPGPGPPGAVGESPSLAQLQNQQNRDQHYLALPGAKYSEPSTYKTVESSDYIKDICPYATFQLNATGPASKAYSDAGSTCSFSGNIYSGPYHSVRGSFVYHDGTAGPAVDTYKLRHKEPEYTKVRRKKSKLRDPHSESQESDNLGSTDSEVKKILSLHLPISEYDTLGSDTEGSSQKQEMASFRHRVPRGARTPRGSVVPCKESSSSSDTSPVDTRKQFQPRKSKSKSQLSGKRHVRSSSGYSSHTEETTFSFSDRIQPPSRFSDSRSLSRDLSETENDQKRRPSRSSVPSRASGSASAVRDPSASFQIDV